MKLLVCPYCLDVVKMDFLYRSCRCHKSYGRYITMNTAEIGGHAEVIAINNHSLLAAFAERGQSGQRIDLDAWLEPVDHKRLQPVEGDYHGKAFTKD